MNSDATIIGFKEDRGKNKDGRLIVLIKELPEHKIIEFLEWLGTEFINKGGLYAVDIRNPKGTYRVYKNNLGINKWIEEK